MTGPRVQRRLAAVAVVDVVGYSRLMEADEAGTLAALKERRKTILDPAMREHQGRVVKLMGDGVLVEFASAVNAVACAVELQKQFSAANEGVADGRRIVLRVGINLGDVVVEGGDLYGDGVIIATRLETMAEPGGICISGSVHEQVAGKFAATFDDLGLCEVKNSSKPVRVFRVNIDGPEPPRTTPKPPSKPAIAVLPFTNMSGDPEQQYFSDGITEDIITELSRFRSLLVIARNSTFQYRDKAADVRRIGAELGARYVVEGSVRKMGGRIRITAQLIDAAHGNHLWSERFDRNLEELFEVQDEVTRTIVATVTGRLEDAEIKSAAVQRTASLPAYDCLLRGVELLRGFGTGDNTRARELFERAIGLDPDFALAHAYLALALVVENHYGQAPQAIKDRALDIALTAVRLDPRDSRCHQFLGQVYRYRGEFDPAISQMEKGIKLNPSDANGLAHFGGLLATSGRAGEGIDLIERAMRLNPYHPEWYWSALAIALYAGRRYEEALAANRKIPGKHYWQMARSAACLVRLGRIEDARTVAAEILLIKPDFHLRAERPAYKYQADAEHLLDAMRKAGLPE